MTRRNTMFNSRDLQRSGKELLDKAEAGEVVQINRNGVVFELAMQGSRSSEDPEVARLVKAIKKEIADIHSVVHEMKNMSEAKPQRKVATYSEVRHDPVLPIVEMACCRRANPCKHWSFDGEVWKNSLSKRTREVE